MLSRRAAWCQDTLIVPLYSGPHNDSVRSLKRALIYNLPPFSSSSSSSLNLWRQDSFTGISVSRASPLISLCLHLLLRVPPYKLGCMIQIKSRSSRKRPSENHELQCLARRLLFCHKRHRDSSIPFALIYMVLIVQVNSARWLCGGNHPGDLFGFNFKA